MDYNEGIVNFDSKMGHLRDLYDTYQAAMITGEVGEEELELLNNTTNNLQHDVDTLRQLLDAHQKTEQSQTEKQAGVKDKGQGKKSKKLLSPSSSQGNVKPRKKKAKKSIEFVVDSDNDDNHLEPAPAACKRAPTEIKPAPPALKKPSLKQELGLSSSSDSEGEFQVHNNEVFEDERKTPSVASTAAEATTEDSVRFVRNPLNTCEDSSSSSSDSDDSRISRKRTRSSSTSRSSSSCSSIKSCSPTRDTSSPVKMSPKKSTSPSPSVDGPSKALSPSSEARPKSNVNIDSTPEGPSSVLPTLKVHMDQAGYWKTHATKLISNLASNRDLFDIKKLAKPRLRICSYFQWASCNHRDKAYHDDKTGVRWFHGCTFCYSATRTIQPHPCKECPFIKLDFVQT